MHAITVSAVHWVVKECSNWEKRNNYELCHVIRLVAGPANVTDGWTGGCSRTGGLEVGSYIGGLTPSLRQTGHIFGAQHQGLKTHKMIPKLLNFVADLLQQSLLTVIMLGLLRSLKLPDNIPNTYVFYAVNVLFLCCQRHSF
jgi:hypothetical protein